MIRKITIATRAIRTVNETKSIGTSQEECWEAKESISGTMDTLALPLGPTAKVRAVEELIPAGCNSFSDPSHIELKMPKEIGSGRAG